VTLRNLVVFGNADTGVRLESSNDHATVVDSTFNSQPQVGLFVNGDDARVTGNTAHDNLGSFSNGIGIEVHGARGLVEDNDAYDNGTGISASPFVTDPAQRIVVRGNSVHDNVHTGIAADRPVLVTANEVFGQLQQTFAGAGTGMNIGFASEAVDNVVHDNLVGISGNGTIRGNRVFHNTQTGISGQGRVEGNRVYSNATGIAQDSGPNSALTGNVVYANSVRGLLIDVTSILQPYEVANNTVYQPEGDAVRIEGSSQNIVLRSNIFLVGSGYAINVADNSQQGFASDYNVLHVTGTGKLARWQGRDFTSLADWFYEVGQDQHSLTSDPLFVDPDGADDVLGYASGDHGADDDFHLQPGSSAVDRGNPAASFAKEPVPNGGRIDIGAYGNTAEATASLQQLVQVLSPAGLEKFEYGQQVTVRWHTAGIVPDDGAAVGTVAVDLVAEDGSGVRSVTLDTIDDGEFLWIVPEDAAPGAYRLRVTSQEGNQPQGMSAEPFQVTNNGAHFYVNDASLNGDEFTTAPGDNANDGKSPSRPMASLAALLAAYNLDPGDVIRVDAGAYTMVRNVVISAQDAGVRIEGPASAVALLNRANTATGSYGIELVNADGVTLERLSITAGLHGIFAATNSDSDNLTLRRVISFSNANSGVRLESGDHVTVEGSTFHSHAQDGLFVEGDDARVIGNTAYGNLGSVFGGITVRGSRGLVEDNEAYENGTGISATAFSTDPAQRVIVRGNLVHDNTPTGIAAGRAVVTGNEAFGHLLQHFAVVGTGLTIGFGGEAMDNVVHDNLVGISGDGAIRGNRVFNSSQVGISSRGQVEGNRVYGNAIGIFQDAIHSSTLKGNLVYGNSQRGLLIRAASNNPYEAANNTVYQPAGDAVRIGGGSRNVTLRNNILWVGAGYAISVADNSQRGFASDYNVLHVTGTGILARWQGRDFTSREDWFYEVGQDQHSLTANPRFVDASAEDFRLRGDSPALDRGDPISLYDNEPAPNGGRIDIGAYGNTADATASPTQLVQVLSPSGLEKIEHGQQVSLRWHSAGLYSPEGYYRDAILADAPLAYYRLNESGTKATDLSGHGRHGNYLGGAGQGMAGALHSEPDLAARFDGVDDRVSALDDVGFRPVRLSLETWVRPDAGTMATAASS
jgi:hypothetical protein